MTAVNMGLFVGCTYYSDSRGSLAPLGLNERYSSNQTVRTNTAGAARMDTIILHKVSALQLEAL